jgi:hypothetical protein
MDVNPVLLAWALAAGAAVCRQGLPAQTGSSRVVLASVADKGNRPLVDLGPDDFIVREAGDAREIFAVRLADYPVVLLIDTGSAARGDFDIIRRAAAHFIARIGSQRPLAVGTLGDPPAMLTTFDDDRAKLAATIDALAANPTADSLLFQGVANAAHVIAATGAPFSAIVIISATAIDATHSPPNELLGPILDTGAIVHVVTNRSSNRNLPGMAGRFSDMLHGLTDQTRGQYTAVFSAASYQTALDHLADRLSSEMMVEFVEPEGTAPSDDVKVGVRIPGARVRGLGVTRK